MIVPMLAAFLLSAAAQDSPPDGNGRSDSHSEGQSGPSEAEARTDSPDAEAPAEEEEEAEPRVCRRVAVYDDFGRQRTRRVCRPR